MVGASKSSIHASAAGKSLSLIKPLIAVIALQCPDNIVGIHPDRVLIDWVSASEGKKFQEVVMEFVERVRELGPGKLPAVSRRR